MKSSIALFGAGTVLLLFAFFSRSTEKSFPPDTLNDKIRITSLSESIPIVNREPVVLPFMKVSAAVGEVLAPEPAKERPAAPEVRAASALVLDLSSARVLLEFKSERRWPIASITKIMTSVIVAEHLDFQKQITLNSEDILAEGSAGDFREGEIFTAGDLVKAMLTASSNDAADAVARFYGRRAFVDLMQGLSRDLGMADTTFADPSGLSSLNQSTAKDIVKLVAYIVKNHPDFLNISAQKETLIKELSSGAARKLKNINKFSGREDFLGGKTGYIDEAGGNLLSIFQYGGRKILVLVFGTEDRFVESERLYDWAKTMLK